MEIGKIFLEDKELKEAVSLFLHSKGLNVAIASVERSYGRRNAGWEVSSIAEVVSEVTGEPGGSSEK